MRWVEHIARIQEFGKRTRSEETTRTT